MSWSTHVKYVLLRAGKRVGMLSRIRVLTTYCANVIYTSFIRPVLDYCDTVWNCCGAKQPSLEMLQRRATRIFCRMNCNSDKAVASLRWNTLQCRCDDHVFNLAKKRIVRNFSKVILLFTRTFVVAPPGKVITFIC